MDSVFGLGARGVVSSSICIVLAAWLVGLGPHVAIRRLGYDCRGVAFTVGLGLAGSALAIEFGALLAGNVLVLAAPGAAISIGYVVYTAVRAQRGDDGARTSMRSALPTSTDWLSGVAAVGLAYPLIRLGLVYFTTAINDFPSYAASAEVWLGRSGLAPEFLQRHPDEFGSYQFARAQSEKPASTAVLVFASLVSRVPSYSLLAPVIVVTLLVFIGNVAAAIRRVFTLPAVAATAAAMIPVSSIVPMSRLHDAQVGHGIAVAFLGLMVHGIVVVNPGVGRWHIVSGGLVVGVLAAVTVAANPTLVLGAGPAWAALVIWLADRDRIPVQTTLRMLAVAGIVTAVCSLPAVAGFRRSLTAQTSGEPGFDIPLPGPSSVVGLQFSLTDVTSTGQTLATWGLVLAGLLIATVVLARTRRYLTTVALIGVVVVNGALVVHQVGITNYATHKWTAVAMVIVAPFLIARLTNLAPPPRERLVAIALVALAVAGGAVSVRASNRVPIRAPLAVYELADNQHLAGLEVVNVRLGDVYQNAIAALTVPSDAVVLSGDGYADPSAPVGDAFVLDAETAIRWGASDIRQLSGSLVSANVDLDLRPGDPVLFDAQHPQSDRFLYGRWFGLEIGGVWTSGQYNRIVFDVPEHMSGQDVTIVLDGARLSGPDFRRDLIVRLDDADGAEIGRSSFDGFEVRSLRMTVDADLVAARGRRIVLHLDTPDPISGLDVGSNDGRTVGFFLTRVALEDAD